MSNRSHCSKHPYPDQAAARQSLEHVRAKAKPEARVPVRVYPCDVCDRWHLTSKRSGRRVPPWDRDPNWVRPGRHHGGETPATTDADAT
jgi:hypothetical protein